MVQDPAYLGIALGLILLNGFFVAAEFAMVRVRATRISERAEEGDWRAKSAEYLIAHLDSFLPATQLAITLTSLGLGWVGEPAFEGLVRPLLEAVGILSPGVVEHVSAALAFMTITFLHIVVGELAPKSYAIRATERVALWTALPMRGFQIVFRPVLWLLHIAADGVLRVAGVTGEKAGESAHSEEELRLLLAESHRSGSLSGMKREILENVIDYTERAARHIMIPRADIVYLSLARSLEENLAVITQTQHTRFPLVGTDIDSVLGMVHIKDLFHRRDQLQSSADLTPLKREILFVPESRPLDALQHDFQHGHTHMAIVVDEYGGTSGLVTLEDVIEEIVGEIQDEFDREPPQIQETPQGLLFDGLTLIDDLADRLGVDLEADEAEVSTVGGLVTARLGKIPRPGDRMGLGTYDLVVMEMRGRRVTKVLARRRPETAAAARSH